MPPHVATRANSGVVRCRRTPAADLSSPGLRATSSSSSTAEPAERPCSSPLPRRPLRPRSGGTQPARRVVRFAGEPTTAFVAEHSREGPAPGAIPSSPFRSRGLGPTSLKSAAPVTPAVAAPGEDQPSRGHASGGRNSGQEGTSARAGKRPRIVLLNKVRWRRRGQLASSVCRRFAPSLQLDEAVRRRDRSAPIPGISSWPVEWSHYASAGHVDAVAASSESVQASVAACERLVTPSLW